MCPAVRARTRRFNGISSMYEHPLQLKGLPTGRCLVLVGMAGAGKSTIGTLLSRALDWGHLDTDRLLESYFGAPLQAIFDELGLDAFRRAEERVVSDLKARQLVISTGGSVIYGPGAMRNLKDQGDIVFLDTPLADVRARVGNAMGRGLAIGPDQSLDDLYAERRPLYMDAADVVVDTHGLSPDQCADRIMAHYR